MQGVPFFLLLSRKSSAFFSKSRGLFGENREVLVRGLKLSSAGGYSRNLLQLCVLFGEKKRKTPFLVIEKWGKCMQSRCCQLKTSLPFALALGLGDVD